MRTKPIQPNHLWRAKKRETINEWALTIAIVLGTIGLGAAMSEAYQWYKGAQKANRAALDSGPLQSNYTARAGDER